MAYSVRRSRACRADLDHLFDHLFRSYQEFGDSAEDAFNRAADRILRIDQSLDDLGRAPHQGTLWPEVMQGLRWTTKDRAIIYFLVDDDARCVDVLAVFFGGQDHKTHMFARIGT